MTEVNKIDKRTKMYQVIYEYGSCGRFFLTEDEVEKEIKDSGEIYIKPYIEYLSELYLEVLQDDFMDDKIFALDKDIWKCQVNDLIAFSSGSYYEDIICLCSKKIYEYNKIAILKKVVDAFGSFCGIKEVEGLTIAVVNDDHEPLSDMYKGGGLTLWHDVVDFITDTHYFVNEECNRNTCIATYEKAVGVWEKMDFSVISNYCNEASPNEFFYHNMRERLY